MKNRSHRYNINRTTPRHGQKYTKYRMCLSMVMVMCNKQHLSNIWSKIHGKVKTELKKSAAYKKSLNLFSPIFVAVCSNSLPLLNVGFWDFFIVERVICF